MSDIGKQIEDFVGAYLQKQGLKLVASNFRCRSGEIDLIMWDQETLVFVEVRYRKTTYYGDALATVSRSKQRKVIQTANYYLQEQNLYNKVLCRFDVVSITGDTFSELNWVKDAFWGKW